MFTFLHNDGRTPLSMEWLACWLLKSSKGQRNVVSSYITIPSENISTYNINVQALAIKPGAYLGYIFNKE